MSHHLFSQNKDMLVKTFDKFDRNTIKNEIIDHLRKNPTDTIEHTKDYSKSDLKRFYGYEVLNVYQVNPKNNKVSLVITKGDKDFFRNIEN